MGNTPPPQAETNGVYQHEVYSYYSLNRFPRFSFLSYYLHCCSVQFYFFTDVDGEYSLSSEQSVFTNRSVKFYHFLENLARLFSLLRVTTPILIYANWRVFGGDREFPFHRKLRFNMGVKDFGVRLLSLSRDYPLLYLVPYIVYVGIRRVHGV